jgi:LEA14-like dessication related protein
VNTSFSIITTTLILVITAGCVSIPAGLKPQVTDVSGKITGIDFKGVNLELQLQIRNPYPIAIQTPQFKYSVGIEGSQLFQASKANRIDLPAMKTGTATLPITIRYLDIPNIFTSWKGKNEVNYSVKGAFLHEALGNKLEIPFSHVGQLPILQPPKLANLKAKVLKIAFSGAAVEIAADMFNPNTFGIDISNLGYSVTLGGQQVGGISLSSAEKVSAKGKVRLNLKGTISASAAALSLLRQKTLPTPGLLVTGAIKTPFGEVKLR